MDLSERVSQLVAQRDFKAAERRKLAKSGAAMPDGSFPITTRKDVENAKTLVGHASDPVAAKRHIIKRAKAIGAEDALPDDWTDSDVQQIAVQTDRTDQLTPGEPLKPIIQAVGTLPFTLEDGTVIHIPYTDTALVAQDETGNGVGVPSTTISDTQPKVGEKNPEQLGKKQLVTQECPKCGGLMSPLGEKLKNPIAAQAKSSMICEQCGYVMQEAGLDDDQDEDDLGKPMPDVFDQHVSQSLVLQMNEEQKVVTFVVQEPDIPTTPATMPDVELIYPKSTIRNMAWGFLENRRNGAIGVMHGEVVTQDGKAHIVAPDGDFGHLVESYVLPLDWPVTDARGNTRLIAQGSWIQSIRVTDPNTWEALKRGELNAISLASTKVKFTDITDATI